MKLRRVISGAIIVIACFSTAALASHNVRGYTRKDGTYVQPHRSMDPYESQRTGQSYHNNELVPRHEYGSSNSYAENSYTRNQNNTFSNQLGSSNNNNNRW